ncbi:glucosyltransferase [Planctomycetales bacterium]|nr:glucosyltransferase [Planctomycetales bacterium]GHS98131.1 glucosyltransferase [Planctomycetales bacterium]GHT05356.1 glucosyltransferase [Planctomycetales bacterium]
MSKPCFVAPDATPATAERSDNSVAIAGEIPVCLAADEYYAPYMAVAMLSIMENAGKNRRYHFYILHRELSAATVAALQQQVAAFSQFAITFINVTEHIKGYNFALADWLSVETYFRLLIPYLLPASDKALYLDCDIICRCDVADLFDIDLQDRWLAAVRDIALLWYNDKRWRAPRSKRLYEVLLNLKNPNDYFNGGMLVLNTQVIRTAYSLPEILALAASRDWCVSDQDMLNFYAEGKTLLLPFRWNFMGYFGLDTDARAQNLPAPLREEWAQAKLDPQLVHYKFWTDFDLTPYAEIVWQYAARTSAYATLMKRGIDCLHLYPRLGEIILRAIKYRTIGGRWLINALKTWLFRGKRPQK